jgi:hypothetical protein
MAENAPKTLKFINLPQFNQDAYRSWAFRCESMFNHYNVWTIVNGDEERPVGNNAAIRARAAEWDTRNNQAHSALLKVIDESQIAKFYQERTAKGIWDRLKAEYGKPNQSKFLKAFYDLMELKPSGKESSFDEYINKWVELHAECLYHSDGNFLQQGLVNTTFVGSLGPVWSNFKSSIEVRLPDLEFAEVIDLVRTADINQNLWAQTISKLTLDEPPVKAFQTSVAPLVSRIESLESRITDSYDPRKSRGNNGNKKGRGNGRKDYGKSHGKGKGRGKNNRNTPYPSNRVKTHPSLLNAIPPPDPSKYCDFCQMKGHATEFCLKRLIKSKELSNRSSNSSQNQGDIEYRPPFNANVTRFSCHSSTISLNPNPLIWVVDSGADAIITPFKERLHNFQLFESNREVKGIGGKTTLNAIGFGTITLTDDAGNLYTLRNAVYVPDAADNILSMMEIREQGLPLHFIEDPDIPDCNGNFKISARKTKFSLNGHAVGKLLKVAEKGATLPPPKSKQLSAFVVTTRSKRAFHELDELDEPIRKRSRHQEPAKPNKPLKCTPEELWHLRLNHPSSSSLKKLRLIDSNYDSSNCRACTQAKQTKLPYRVHLPKTTRVLERIHSDLAGPFPDSKGNSKYVLTFLDDFTHFAQLATIRDKSSSTLKKVIAQYIREVERFHNQKVVYLHIDKGREYMGDVEAYLTPLGIKLERTSGYSPQSNGKAERLNRTLSERLRANLFQANMPDSYWAEAMHMACQTLNYLPSEGCDGQIPWELWHKKELTQYHLSSLKPFGCIVDALVEEPNRKGNSKTVTRSTRGCLVGMPSTTFYRIWDFELKRFRETHHARFYETQFPIKDDFNERPTAPPTRTNSAPKTTQPPPEERPIYDQIVVELPPALKAFTTKTTVKVSPLDTDPATFQEALKRSDAHHWIDAMNDEIKNLGEKKTWTLTDLPPGKHAIGCKWVYRIKKDGTGQIERYRARVVAKGFYQIFGIDFDKTFAPVIRIESVRHLFALAAHHGWEINHVDFKTAFANGESDMELYLTQPEGFVDPRYPKKVLRLNKSLYGLKQAPRIWYLLLCSVIRSLGFEPLKSDPCIYRNPKTGVIAAVYVDDVLILGQNQSLLNAVYNELSKHFEAVNKGFPKTFLGLNIIRNSKHSITINQCGYIDKMLKRFNLSNARTVKTPLATGRELLKSNPDSKILNDKETTRYQEIVGSINHLALFSRPDVAFAVSKLSQFNAAPSIEHLQAAKHVLRYLKLTRNYSITYGNGPLYHTGLSDADWASDKNDRKSFTGYVFLANNGPVSWTSHKQSTVSLSTLEAEYKALSDASRESIARSHLYEELGIHVKDIPVIYSDNLGALNIAEDPTNYARTKHIDIRYHFIRDCINNNQLAVDHVPGDENPADILTKALGPTKHDYLIELLGMRKDFVKRNERMLKV